ncbi:MAG: ywlE [Firmicutes bacterium]|nr:ywlE [Bacillota bacterium]
MFKILLVCTGNTCRSPMAAALLTDMVKKAGLDGEVVVDSAGVSAWQQPASKHAQTIMRQNGLQLDKHYSKQLDVAELREADLVLAMTNAHKRAIFGLLPVAEVTGMTGKIYTLTEFAGVTGDVTDPFGGSEAEYYSCAQQLQQLLNLSWGKIVKLAGKK